MRIQLHDLPRMFRDIAPPLLTWIQRFRGWLAFRALDREVQERM